MRLPITSIIPANAGTQLQGGFQLGPRIRGGDKILWDGRTL